MSNNHSQSRNGMATGEAANTAAAAEQANRLTAMYKRQQALLFVQDRPHHPPGMLSEPQVQKQQVLQPPPPLPPPPPPAAAAAAAHHSGSNMDRTAMLHAESVMAAAAAVAQRAMGNSTKEVITIDSDSTDGEQLTHQMKGMRESTQAGDSSKKQKKQSEGKKEATQSTNNTTRRRKKSSETAAAAAAATTASPHSNTKSTARGGGRGRLQSNDLSLKRVNTHRLVAKRPRTTAVPPPSASIEETTDISGEFVDGVLYGQLLSCEKQSNQKRAFSNIVLCANGEFDRGIADQATSVKFPPSPVVTLNLRRARLLAEGFVDDRNNAVREAVRIAYTEMQANHDAIMIRQNEHFLRQLERANDLATAAAASNPPPSSAAVASNKVVEERLYGEIQHLNEQLKVQALQKNKEIASLKRVITNNERKRNTDSEALSQAQDEIASLKEKIKYMKDRQKRSMSAVVEASVHSLRLFQKKRRLADTTTTHE